MTLAAILNADYLGIKEFKEHLCKILKKNKPHIITEYGKPKQFIIPYNEMIEIVEILEEMSDPEFIKEIQTSRKSYKKGKEQVPVNKLWAELGIKK